MLRKVEAMLDFGNWDLKDQERILNLVLACSVGLIVLFLLLPLMQNGVVYGDDFPYHISRIEGLANAMKERNCFSGIRTYFLDGYGYGTGFFYCETFIIIPAFLRFLGCSLENSYKVLQMSLVLSITVTSLIGFREISRNKVAAVVGTILFVGSHYFMLNLFSRSAVGETSAMIFLPLVVAGLYNVIRDDFSKPWLLVIGLAGACLSHTISTVFYIIICVIVLGINVKKVIINKVLLKLIVSGIMTLGITAFYWLPMLEQLFVQEYQLHHPWVNISEQSISMIGALGNARYSVGYLLVILVILFALLADRKCFKRNLVFVICPAIGLIIISLQSFWEYFGNLLGFMQFPWRLLSLITMSFVIFIVNILSELLEEEKSKKKIIVFIITLLLFYVETNYEYYEERVDDVVRIEDAQENIELHMLGGGREWLPVEVNIDKLMYEQENVIDDGMGMHRKKEALSFEIKIDEKTECLEAPFIYYKGYEAYNLTKGKRLRVVKSDNGLVEVDLDNIMVGDIVVVEYKDTMITWMARILSIFTVIVHVWCILKIKGKKKLI